MNSKLASILRIVLALVLLVFGTNKFFNFLPMPPMEGEAAEFMGFLGKTGYFFPLIAVVEIFSGFLLLINKWKGFALVLFAPVSVNIILYHINYDIGGIGPGALVFVLNISLIYANWKKYKTLF